jgi:hypothetical protein
METPVNIVITLERCHIVHSEVLLLIVGLVLSNLSLFVVWILLVQALSHRQHQHNVKWFGSHN